MTGGRCIAARPPSDDLREEGQAQNAKGTEELKATKADAEAQAHEKAADAAEQKQEAAERAD